MSLWGNTLVLTVSTINTHIQIAKRGTSLKTLTMATIALGLSLTSFSYAQNVSLTTTNWVPYYGDNLEQGGFISVIVNESFKASGYQSELEFAQWTDAMRQVKEGEKDVLVGAFYSDERAQDYHISIPIYSVFSGVIKHKNLELDFYSSYEMLNQYKIGKIEGAVVGQSFDSFPFEKLQGFAGTEDGIQALQNGQINLFADNLSVAKSAASKLGLEPSDFAMVQPPIEKNDLYIMISKKIANAEKIRDDFNAGFIKIQTNGTYDAVLKQFNQL